LKRTIRLLILLGSSRLSLEAQAPARWTIDTRRIATVTDADGRGFSSPPLNLLQTPGGDFLLVERGSAPAVIDRNGRFVKALGRLGAGPGELFEDAGPFRVGANDTLFVLNRRIDVFSPTRRYVRSVRAVRETIEDFLPLPDGFIVTTPAPRPDGTYAPFHITTSTGAVVRSFGSIIMNPREGGMDGRFALAASSTGTFWAAPYMQHRFERWTTDGKSILVIDTIPPWYAYVPVNKIARHRSLVRAFREVNGQLWVMSSVPVPNADDILREATGRSAVLEEGRRSRVPLERLSTTMLEVYDVASGKLIAELPVSAYGVTFLDDHHFATYGLNSVDLPQLQIWEMKLNK
jgi:hypothetical protein